MSIELYSSIDELIKKEEKAGRNPADYCFDEAWLIWLDEIFGLQYFAPKGYRSEYIALAEMLKTPEYSASIVADYYVRIACASTEIGQRLSKAKANSALGRKRQNPKCYFGYASDFGDVQKSMYALRTKDSSAAGDCFTCTEDKRCVMYSKDMMTNFGFVFRMVIALLSHDTKSFDRERSFGRRSKPLNAELFISGFDRYANASTLIPELEKQLNEFAHNSSRLGNYCCILGQLGSHESLNQEKGLSLSLTDGTCVNDQFALFAEWINELCESKSRPRKEELNSIDIWRGNMLFDHEIWNRYTDAVLAYKAAFASLTLDSRLAQFSEYLRLVNKAIETRSEQIVKTIKGPKEIESTQAK